MKSFALSEVLYVWVRPYIEWISFVANPPVQIQDPALWISSSDIQGALNHVTHTSLIQAGMDLFQKKGLKFPSMSTVLKNVVAIAAGNVAQRRMADARSNFRSK